nr:MAG TPA: hypothetical protein [Caudoviricetes sp.]
MNHIEIFQYSFHAKSKKVYFFRLKYSLVLKICIFKT